jgi:hypothetical protein
MIVPYRPLLVPLLLAIASLAGLVAGLLGEGPWDMVAWLGLAAPLAAITWSWRRPR